MNDNPGFDIQVAWLRRFSSDAESSLHAFALRMKEALPDRVDLRESRGLFSRTAKTTGLTVEIGDKRYNLDVDRGRLRASVSMVVKGIALNTHQIDAAAWFAQLSEETRKATDQARALSESLHAFMAG